MLSVQPPSDPSTAEGTRRNSLEKEGLSPMHLGGNTTNPFRPNYQAPSIGLQMPFSSPTRPGMARTPTQEHAPRSPLLSISTADQFDAVSPYSDPYGDPYQDLSDGGYFGANRDLASSVIPEEEGDMVRLTDGRFLAPIAGHPQPMTSGGSGYGGEIQTPRQSSEMGGRLSFQSVHFGNSPSSPRQSRLGDDLPPTTPDGSRKGRGRAFSFGQSLSPEAARRTSRSPSAANSSRLVRAGSVMRAMSQRVANIGNDDELPEVPKINIRGRKESAVPEMQHPPGFGLPPITLSDEENAESRRESIFSQVEGKRESISQVEEDEQHMQQDHLPVVPPPWPINNPLRGKSL